jgi:hypothetical protein
MRPTLFLRFSGSAELVDEPLLNQWVRPCEAGRK